MKKRRERGRFFGAPLLVLTLALALTLVGGTLAYLWSGDSPVMNTFALANVKNEIIEEQGGSESDKVVYAKNTGESPIYVRARLLISRGTAALVYGEPADPRAANTIYVRLGSGWTLNSDGYYYYGSILQAQETSTPLVNGVYAGAGVDANSFDVIVTSEAVLASESIPPQQAFATVD